MSRPAVPAGASPAIVIKVPMSFRRRSGRKRIEVVNPDGTPAPIANSEIATRSHDPLTVAIARAHRWQELLDSGKYGSISALTRDLKVDFGYVSRLLQLTLLAPDIIEKILSGRDSSGLSLTKLGWRLPLIWTEQRAMIDGLAPGRQRGDGVVSSDVRKA